jgi:predicted CopG family antitoxin
MAAKYSNRYQVTAYVNEDVYDKLERLRSKTARSCFVEKLLKRALRMEN